MEEIVENFAEVAPPPAPSLEVGAWIGQAQAFTLVSSHCSADQALCLQRLRDSRAFESAGMTWDEFCRRYAGITRSSADRIIQKLQEFGETYFHLAGIIQVSAAAYRRIAPSISQEGLELDGEIVPIVPENAARIRRAVQGLRVELACARRDAIPPSVADLQARFDAWYHDLARLAAGRLEPGTLAGLHGLLAYATRKLQSIASGLAPAPP